MGLFERFFGRKDSGPEASGPLTANPALEKPLSLQILFPGALTLDPEALTATLRQYHRDMRGARCELDTATAAQGTPLGLVGWGKHVIRLVGFNAPMPPQVVETVVAPAHYPQELKQQARQAKSHLLLYYAGYESDPLEQYVALAAVAGCLGPQGALLVANESARTSLPIGVFAPGNDKNMLALLRAFPLLMLYAGFVKGDVPGVPGVWMRTFGCPLLNLPDLAMHTPSHDHGQSTFETFCSVLDYLRTSRARIEPGHTSQVGEDEFLRFRSPRPEEQAFLFAEGNLLVAEHITATEINR